MRGYSLCERHGPRIRDPRPRTWRDKDWVDPPEKEAFPGESSPHGVGAANSGLHSTSCRSSDGGEVHSLGGNTRGVIFSAEATYNAVVFSFSHL